MATPYATVVVDTVGSTQDEARRLLTGSDEPVLVAARSQTSGRGRGDHEWRNAPRALASSLALRTRWPSETWPRIGLATGLAVRTAVLDVVGVETGLKWPNDLVVADRKVAGILVESRGDVVVVGCGVNLWWPDPPTGFGALCADDPGEAVGPVVAARWAEQLLGVMEGSPERWGRDAYREVCLTVGEMITWEPDGAGRAVDIAPDGGLVVETTAGRTTLASGDVRTVRRATVAPGMGQDTAGDDR